MTQEVIQLAQWTAAYINSLPDGSFAFIEDGGSKDAENKTTPRSLRHLPYKDASGKVDLPHLRNALARLPQSSLSAEAKAKAQRKLEAAARSAGVGDYGKSAWSALLSALGKKLGWTSQEVHEVRKQMEADSEEPVTAETFDALQRERDVQETLQEFLSYYATLQHSLQSILADPQADKAALVQQSLEEFSAAVKECFSTTMQKSGAKISATRLANLKAVQALIATIIHEQEPPEPPDADKGEPMADATPPQTPGQPPAPTPDDLMKSLPEPLRELLQKTLSETEVAKREAAEAKEQARIEKDARELQEFTKRAERELASLPGTAQDKGTVLKALYSGQPLVPEQVEKLVHLLKAAEEMARQGKLFSEFGRTTPTPEPGSAYGRLSALAQDMVVKGESPTFQQAMSTVADRYPELVQEHRQEQRRQAH